MKTKRKFRELSMGDRKKVAMVQALMLKPKLLILDEPTMASIRLFKNCCLN